MTDAEKQTQLRKFKVFATGLFLAMVLVYAATTWILKTHPQSWLAYLQAFSEAGMVGALADWFAVTALFHKPLGLPIPHTNLIENSKQRIGNNLGNFVANNFLNAQSIRPYIEKLHVSRRVADWISNDKNLDAFLAEMRGIALDIVYKLNDIAVANFISEKIQSALPALPIPKLMADGIDFLIEKGEHQKFVTLMSGKLKEYIKNNEGMVRDRVTKESYFFIPKFVDDKLSEKITRGLYNYFQEIEINAEHPLRFEITRQLRAFGGNLRSNEQAKIQLQKIADEIMSPENINRYTTFAWLYVKKNIVRELRSEGGPFWKFISQSINNYSSRLQHDVALQSKLDGWIRLNAYRVVLRNKKHVSHLISNTVGNWKGRELSNKLELEVGKDLQYIRVNGTIVGGLMGLLIYALTHLFGK